MPVVPSRLLASRFGSRWTYAGNAVAPGQIPASRMVDEFRFRDGRVPTTAIYGVVGNNVMHSMSPVDAQRRVRGRGHRCGLRAAARRRTSTTFSRLPTRMRSRASASRSRSSSTRSGRAGYADALDADGRRGQHVAARPTRRWDATNTDVDGFLDPLEAVYPGSLTGARAAVLGAGGAARAVTVALASRGARVTVHARRA